MKKLLILFSISLNFSLSANYVKVSDIENDSIKTVFMKQSRCGSGCMKLPSGYNKAFHILTDVMTDDMTLPIYEAKSKVSPCQAVVDDVATVDIDETKTQEQDCMDKVVLLYNSIDCKVADGYDSKRSVDNSEAYCTRLLGYQQKTTGVKHVIIDESKKTSYEAQRATAKAESDAISSQLKEMDYGKMLYASIQLLSKSKGLTKAQRRLFRKNNKDLKDDLLEGNLCQVRSDLLVLAVDGIMITSQSEIDGIVAKIDSYKTCQ